jgi:hypothetical protein
LEMSQSLLQRHTANFVKKLQVFLLFPLCQHCIRFFLTLPGFESAGILGSATHLKTIYPCGNT